MLHFSDTVGDENSCDAGPPSESSQTEKPQDEAPSTLVSMASPTKQSKKKSTNPTKLLVQHTLMDEGLRLAQVCKMILSPMRTTCGLVKLNIISVIGPIRESVREIVSLCKFVRHHFQKPYHNWLKMRIFHDSNQSEISLGGQLVLGE